MEKTEEVHALKAIVKDNILLTDGAMGTYYAVQHNGYPMSEFENIEHPEIIRGIHLAYVEAGAKLLRTNTFAANCKTLNTQADELIKIIKAGYRIAREAAADRDVFVAADIGPIPENTDPAPGPGNEKNRFDEYIEIIDAFLEEGARIFWFETFGKPDDIEFCAEYIKKACPVSFINAQFAFDSTGYTREGVSLSTIRTKMAENPRIDAWGFNCAMGPVHMLSLIEGLPVEKNFILSALPNTGYPVIKNQRTVYPLNPEYFADRVMKIVEAGAKIVGGCCGTTPEHIKAISKRLYEAKYKVSTAVKEKKEVVDTVPYSANSFKEKLDRGEKVIMVELDPPFTSDTASMLQSAEYIKDLADAITVADSPLGKVRADSLMVASRIKRRTGIDVVPHLCCRDKNIVGLKSGILGAHGEGIRNILVITGDPLPGNERAGAKSVFNLNSKGLISLINEMNNELFANSEIYIGAAINPNVPNFDAQLRKTEEKTKAGARFFLSQPVYSDEAAENLLRAKKELKVKIIAGILPIVSYNNAVFLNNEVPGIVVPEEYIRRFYQGMDRDEAYKVGLEIALECIRRTEGLDGVYFMPPFNRVTMIAEIIRKMKASKR
jgi:methionine synthase I (cobalamin-dependent)/5,10-methylenetetrahydrofolate reductase